MKRENKGVGLDIGTTKIVAMLGRKTSMESSKLLAQVNPKV
ncbi:MAG: hypothetical protein CM15mP59_2150 [Flavobacteriaceae bacterium]|nr:MAG: hypothetical protein CM15mP59_2150 [Flavobacteriaceae bacterium]